MDEQEGRDKEQVLPPLSRNAISFAGWVLTGVVGAVLVVLVAADMLMHFDNPYNSLVTYLVLPGMLGGSIMLILAGIGWEWRRRHKADPGTYPTLPTIDLNRPWQRRRILIGAVLMTLFFTFSALGVYRAYHFTESPVFCGQVCHMVMKPEFTAYQHSPHARVACVQCHIGSGADWYVKSKMSGLRQVYAVLSGDYELPIPTPVENLRPARETCEQCHWPEKFSDSVEKVYWHFAPDRANTPTRFNMLLRIGGGAPTAGLGHGIHWHISPGVEVRYWARDKERMDIPWVEVRRPGAEPVVYKSPDCPETLPPEAEVRTMDCIDCHNRPSHIYRSPHQLIDFNMANGVLDASLPSLKRYAGRLFEKKWSTTPEALAAIESTLTEEYAATMEGPRGAALVKRQITALQELYQQNFFPEQKVDWREYPNHLGHFEFPGCYRCHDGKHAAEGGAVVENDCQTCHEMLDQAEGEAAFEPIKYRGGPFIHPRGLGEIWVGKNCTDCPGLTSEPAVQAAAVQ